MLFRSRRDGKSRARAAAGSSRNSGPSGTPWDAFSIDDFVDVSDMPRTIQRDPFQGESWLTLMAAAPPPVEGVHQGPSLLARMARRWSDMQDQKSRLEQEAERRLAELKLQSTLIGPVNSAYISGRLVHVGDNVAGFSVVKITPGAVVLAFSGIQRTLSVP